MANKYVTSVSGDNADDGSTIDLADATLAGGIADASSGDRIWVSHVHSESTAAAISLGYGSLTLPGQIYCGDFASEPPTAVTTGAVVTTTGASNISLTGVGVFDGITFTDSTYVHLRNCNLNILGTSVNPKIQLSTTTGALESRVLFENVNARFSSTSQGFDLRHCRWIWSGGAITTGSTPTTLISLNGDVFDCLIENVNFSAMGAGMNIFANSGAGIGTGIIRNCAMPSGWSGSLGQPTQFNTRFEMWNWSADDSVIRVRIADVMGTLQEEGTIVRTGGASDGTTGYSHKIFTSGTAEYPSCRFVGPENAIFNGAVGSAITLTVEIVHDSQGAGGSGALQDDEIALEVSYPGTSGLPLYSKVSSVKSNPVGSASDLASSSETWTTTGMTTPVKQKLSVTFTPQEIGVLIWRIIAFKASKTIYYCPKPALS
jgi:hypothetical protein